MIKQFQKIQWLACVLILILGLVGCESLAPDSNVGPTAPVDVSPDPANLANFWVGRGQNKFGVYMGTEFAQFQVPEGSFMVEYITLLGVFQIVLKAEGDGAFLGIGLLEGDVLLNVNIYQGDIPEDATPQIEKEGVKIFCWPGSSVIVNWGNVFVVNPWIAVIVLIKDGVIVTDNPDIVIEELKLVEASEFTIITEVLEGCGSIGPSEISGIPAGASRSLKIRACTGLCADIVDVRVNGFPTPVQCLGNGDGHLVIHNIREDILVTARFN